MTTTRDSDVYAQLAIASDAVKTEVTKTQTKYHNSQFQERDQDLKLQHQYQGQLRRPRQDPRLKLKSWLFRTIINQK